MTIIYYNDESQPVTVYLNDFHSAPDVLAPQEEGLFEIELPEGSAAFIKRWPNGIILISSMELETL